MNKLRLFAILFFLTSIPVIAQDIPQKPTPPRLVNDFADFLSPQEEQMLENKLVAFDRATSTQIVIVTVKSLDGYDKSQYAYAIGEKWGVGQKEFDNGIVILVKPKTSNDKGEVFIAPGYGLEGTVPDAVANRIVDHEIIPAFQQGQYYKGMNAATDILISITKGEYSAQKYYDKTQQPSGKGIGILIFIVLIIIFSILGKVKNARQYSIGHNIPFWVALFMMGSASRSHGGFYNNFSSGSGGFGGFSGGGGGFGGFGGGSFGGGGAGGSW